MTDNLSLNGAGGVTKRRIKTSREAFEDTFRWEFRHNSRNWVDSQLARINVGYVGAVAQSHWMTWQAACKFADGMED